jgi:hypothetical protein
MSERHVYHEGSRMLCGLPWRDLPTNLGVAHHAELGTAHPEWPMCPTCAWRDAAARLGGFKWVTCTGCRGAGHVARTDSAVTSCFQCMNAGVMPSIRQGWCSCGHWRSKHDEHAGCLEGGCGCTSYESTA